MMKGRFQIARLWCAVACVLHDAHAYTIRSNVWKFQNHPIAYDRASTSDSSQKSKTPVLLLNGFGVGSFHQHNLIRELLENYQVQHADRELFAMDYLGQGKSWPDNCNDGEAPSENGLSYSGATWVQQIVGFLEQVVLANDKHTRVHLVGNSVGGHLAVFVAASRPDLVASLSLLNVTPVWGLNLPGWSGHLPAPWIPKLTGRYLFDRIRDLDTIRLYLNECYANPNAFDENLVQQIRGCTEGKGGHAAFASILWSPPVTVPESDSSEADFDACLRALDCDTLLLFGEDDPWCKPAFGRRMLQSLSQRGNSRMQRYVGLSQVGHCPNHEAPKAVAQVVTSWLKTVEDGSPFPFDGDRQLAVQEAWGETVIRGRSESDIPASLSDRLVTSFM